MRQNGTVAQIRARLKWNELVEMCVDQFIFNTMIDVTLRDLETAKQRVRETFPNT